MAEEKKELLGFQPHIRTIMEDIEIGVQDKVNVIYSYFFLVFSQYRLLRTFEDWLYLI